MPRKAPRAEPTPRPARAAKKASPKKPSTKKAPAAKAAKKAAHTPAVPRKKAAAPKAPRAPASKIRVVVPKDLYEPRKEAIKAPLREHGLKWQFLGEGKGRYHKEGVNLFVQFLDDGVHYSLWGDDQATVGAISAAWRALLGEAVFAQAAEQGAQAERREEEQKESEAIKLWRLQEPQPRPGEPDFFFRKRVEEWRARKPQA